MLQARLFSYGDAQRCRLGINHRLIPANAPRCPVHSYHCDGAMRVDGNFGGTLGYEPNSYGNGKSSRSSRTAAQHRRRCGPLEPSRGHRLPLATRRTWRRRREKSNESYRHAIHHIQLPSPSRDDANMLQGTGFHYAPAESDSINLFWRGPGGRSLR